ncbi:MAG: thioredoxin domain-containing protein [Anaerolineaceae bacterium]|nr:thioredoxin domain-containing protein [Anaerolineaceae bacterium]
MNHLKNETSPYLLQHADNPVDWYPWGEEALAVAQAQDKPILLSVGYSACHWCHVMAHESFEHEPTAQMMNDLFINIKVDREERPDVDAIYMQAVQRFNNGQGGWPMTVFLLPDGKPFFGGTYYPRESRYGMPSFRQVLQAVNDAYVNKRDDLNAQADEMTQYLDRTALNIGAEDDAFTSDLLDTAARGLMAQFDNINGGLGGAPKFPTPVNLAYLLRHHVRTGDKQALHIVTYTLKKMARGGIYDQIGGGFARYSVDAQWLVPHFEKMLYDNAQLSRLYLHTYQVTGDAFFRRIAEDIYDYILREMAAPEGGFYSATDADSEGEEGKFFVWTIDEVREVLEPLADDLPNAADIAIRYYGLTPGGNFEGSNILHVPDDMDIAAADLGLSAEDLQSALSQINDRLYAARAMRVHPGLDDKILTAWNGMMLASLAEAARVLGREDYLVAAERAADFLIGTMLTSGNRLLRTYNQGQARLNGYLEDYAHVIDALLEMYQSTYLEKWFILARDLADVVLEHFTAEDGGFFDTSDDHDALIVRPRTLQDGATASGNSAMASQLLRLAAYTGDARYEEPARSFLRMVVPLMQQYPQAIGEGLNAADMLVNGIAEVAIVGNPVQDATKALLKVVRDDYYPNVITALARNPVDGDDTVPLLSYRTMRDSQPTVYVCRNFVCQMPVTSPEEMTQLLES